MARALTVQRSRVAALDRPIFLSGVRRKRAHYGAAECRYWVFEDVESSGAFLEFVEAADRDTLDRAHATSPEPVSQGSPVYVEVEML
jgi:hypothetical protein